MSTHTLSETEIDAGLLQKAEAIYAAAGLSVDDAVHQLLLRTVEQQAVPLTLIQLKPETQEAIAAARQGDFEGEGSIDDFFAELNAEN